MCTNFRWTYDFFSLLGIYLEVELLGYMVWVSSFEELPDCFPKQLYHFTFPPSSVRGFRLLHTLANTCLCYCSHPNDDEVVSRWGFWISIPDGSWCWTTLHVLSGYVDIFREVSILILCPFYLFFFSLPILKLGCLYKLLDFFMYFRYEPLVRYMICKHFLLFLWIVISLSWWCSLKLKSFSFDEVQFHFSLVACDFGVILWY